MYESAVNVLFSVPFVLLVVSANLADRQRLAGGSGKAPTIIAYVIHNVFFGLLAIVGVVLHIIGLRLWTDEGLTHFVFSILAGGPTGDPNEFIPILLRLKAIGMALWVPSLTAFLCLLPGVRKQLSKVIPIDSRSSTHAVAIALVAVVAMRLALLRAIGTEILLSLPDGFDDSLTSMIFPLLEQGFNFTLLALLGVGWLTRRKLPEVLERLALVIPRPTSIAVGIGAGLLWIGFTLAWPSIVDSTGLTGMNLDEQLGEGRYQGFFRSIPAMLLVALVIGISDEVLFRGALQPRFGFLLTCLVFVAFREISEIGFHTLDSLSSGLILGLLRARFNTTTCAIAHSGYYIMVGLTEHFYPHVF